MHKTTITMTVRSADEFKEKLQSIIKPSRKPRPLVLLLQDHQVYVNMFHVKNGSRQEVRYQLLMEAVEKLSLPAEDIVLDYRILCREDDSVSGVYLCASRDMIEEYVSLADPRAVRLVKMTDKFLCQLDRFQKTEDCQGRCYCFLYVAGPREFRIAVLQDARITFIRHVPFDDINEASEALIQTLRFACANSKIKSLDGIFWAGDTVSGQGLKAVLEKNIDCPVKELTEDAFGALPHVNLLKDRLQWQKTQKTIYAAWTAGVTIIFLLTGSLTWKIFKLETEIGRVSSSYSVYDYELAQKYKERLSSHE